MNNIQNWKPSLKTGNQVSKLETESQNWKPNLKTGNRVSKQETKPQNWKPRLKTGNRVSKLEIMSQNWRPNSEILQNSPKQYANEIEEHASTTVKYGSKIYLHQ